MRKGSSVRGRGCPNWDNSTELVTLLERRLGKELEFTSSAHITVRIGAKIDLSASTQGGIEIAVGKIQWVVGIRGQARRAIFVNGNGARVGVNGPSQKPQIE